MNYHNLKNVEPPMNVQLLIYNLRNGKFIFGIRKKIDGKDCFFVSQTYPADGDTAFRYGFKKFTALNGSVALWACLFKPFDRSTK